MPKSAWSGKNLMDIEGEVQKVMSEIGNALLSNHILPERVNEIEDGPKKCECGRDYEVQKKVNKTVSGIYGNMPVSRTQYYCGDCEKYLTLADGELV